MSILNHFNSIIPTVDQKNAAEKLEQFINDDSHVFILQGYAGTGKTTLLKTLIEYLKAQQLLFSALAPTGRAAKILRDKTGTGSTIHSAIYDFLLLANSGVLYLSNSTFSWWASELSEASIIYQPKVFYKHINFRPLTKKNRIEI